MAGLKTASGEAIDGSFELQVDVDMDEDDAVGQPGPTETPGPTAASRTLALRVTGDLHVGGLMLLIVETIGRRQDWSDHALWWPQRRHWLLRSARSLDALGVGGDARLRFTRQHRPLRLRLPHGRRLRMRLSFARALPHAVAEACGILGIRHPEELSLLRPPEEEEEVGGGGGPCPAPDFDLTHISPPHSEEGPWQEPPPHLPPECYRMLVAPRGGLAPVAPPRPPRGNPLLRRTRLHSRWLDSSRSLLEQDVADDEELLLCFKYHCFMELEPREALRLALLYEQARWALLREEIDCTEEEMLLFAALQYQIDEMGAGAEPGGAGGGHDLDDLDTALSNLEVKLGGGPEPPAPLEELAAVPELAEELEVYRPRRLTLRGFRPVHAVLKDTGLVLGRGPPGAGEAPLSLNLRGCEVTPDVDAGGRRFCIKLLVPTPEGMSELHLRCRDAPQYARWVTGCRLAARGRSLSDASFAAEARAVQALLGLPPSGSEASPAPLRAPPDPRVLLPPRLQRKGKAKQLVPRILEVLHRVGALSPAQARLRFLEAWKALPGFGLAYFLVQGQPPGRGARGRPLPARAAGAGQRRREEGLEVQRAEEVERELGQPAGDAGAGGGGDAGPGRALGPVPGPARVPGGVPVPGGAAAGAAPGPAPVPAAHGGAGAALRPPPLPPIPPIAPPNCPPLPNCPPPPPCEGLERALVTGEGGGLLVSMGPRARGSPPPSPRARAPPVAARTLRGGNKSLLPW